MMSYLNYDTGVLIARVFLGVLFLMQGYDKVFRIGLINVAKTFREELPRNSFPPLVVSVSAYLTSYIEFFGGILLLIGLFQYWALALLGLDLILVAVAMSSIEPLWKMDFVFPRLVLVLLLLLLPEGLGIFSLDHLLGL